MLVEVQKVNRTYKELQGLLIKLIREEYEKSHEERKGAKYKKNLPPFVASVASIVQCT
jgi:hypothetical protein